MALAAILREGVLNDDTLYAAEQGECFGRRDYLYKVVYWTFANAWCDHKHHFFAKTLDAALARYERICGKLEEDTIYSVYACLAE